jgi:hypothetical protein
MSREGKVWVERVKRGNHLVGKKENRKWEI